MIYAINTGLLEANPASTISQAFEKPKKQNLPTVKPEILPQLMSDISMSNLQVTTRALLLWQLLTLVRPSEAAGTKWVEIDLENKLWHIPAKRMKAKKAHTVPLSNEALGLLAQLKPLSSGSEYVFPSRINRNEPLNPQTANAALKSIGYGGQLVAHGLRSIASTTMNKAEFNPDVIEAALAHNDKNEVRRAYNRSTYLEQRKELMAWWGKRVYEKA